MVDATKVAGWAAALWVWLNPLRAQEVYKLGESIFVYRGRYGEKKKIHERVSSPKIREAGRGIARWGAGWPTALNTEIRDRGCCMDFS